MVPSVAQRPPAVEIKRGRGRPRAKDGDFDPRVIGVELKMELTARDLAEIDSNNMIIRALAQRNRLLMRRVDANRAETRAMEQGPCAA